MVSDKIIIGITGKAQSGKSTIAAHLCRMYGFQEFPLASGLKKAATALFGWSASEIETSKDLVDPYYGISPRQFLQALGTDFTQHILSEMYPEYGKVTGRLLHMKRFHSFYNTTKATRIVIPDIRFPHEINYLTLSFNNAIILNTSRPKEMRGDVSPHDSEHHIDELKADYFIHNDTNSFSALFAEVDATMREVLHDR